jgi:hypothetical protein
MMQGRTGSQFATRIFSSIERTLLALVSLFLLSGIHVAAQLTTGTITGTVTDQSGAAVPGASVSAKNTETGLTRTTVTGPTGRYEHPNLPIGMYEVTATSAGFQTSVRGGVTLSVGQNPVVDHALQVGNVTEQVTVTGEVSLVETTTATVSQLVDEKTVEELPLRDRDLMQLTYLQPGVMKSTSGSGVFSGMGEKITVAGARHTQNLFLLDGVSNTDFSNNPQGASGAYTGAETVKEFQIITNNYSAEYQSTAGGIVSAVTKSGTNTIHGSGFWTMRNDNLDANSFGNNRSVPFVPKRDFSRNQFGGSLGGPIIRDKTFYFGSYEGFRQDEKDTDTIDTFTDATRAGILPIADGGNGDGVTPTEIVNPIVKRYMDLWPRPNTPFQYANDEAFGIRQEPCDDEFGPATQLCDHNSDGSVTLLAPGWDEREVVEDFLAAKIDHQFAGQKMGMLSGSYNFSDSHDFSTNALTELGSGTVDGASDSRKHTLGVSHTSVITPVTINEFKFGYSWSTLRGDIPLTTQDFSDLANLPGRTLFGELSAPLAEGIGWRVNFSKYNQTSYQFKESLSTSRGAHSFRLGTEVKLFRFAQESCSRGCNGVWDWDDINAFLRNEPAVLEIFTPGHDNPERKMKQLLFGGYFQDNWQMMPTLTLNLGLRYEFTTVPKEENGLVSSLRHHQDPFISVSQEVKDDPRYANDPSMPETIDGFFLNPTLKSFSPRLGFAWAPGSKKFSIRGGTGIFYEYPMLYNIRTVLQEAPPFVLTGNLPRATAQAAGLNLQLRPGIGGDPAFTPLLTSTPNARAMEYDMKNVTIYRWSLTLQQELATGTVVSAGYTGSRGVHLWHQSLSNANRWIGFPDNPTGQKVWPLDPRNRTTGGVTTANAGADCANLGRNLPACIAPFAGRINPNFGEIRIQSANADSYFHGLAIGAQQRMTRGISFQLAYNWSKSVDSGSGVTSGGDEYPQGQRDGFAYWDMRAKKGLSQFDRRHTLTTNFTYEMPGQDATGIVGRVVGGWKISGIVTAQGGNYLSLGNSSNVTIRAVSPDPGLGLRPNLIPGGDHNPVVGGRFIYYDHDQFLPQFCTGIPARVGSIANARAQQVPVCQRGDAEYYPGVLGQVGRNTLRAPGSVVVDMSIQKDFRFGENQRAQFRAEAFNAFNKANMGGPGTTPFDASGRPSSTFGVTEQITSGGTPRTIQLGLKYTF